MQRKHKISAFIPVQNVEDIIEKTLDTITWVDEIFIVDAFSTDKTVEICKRYPNVKIVRHEYENSGAQRYWGMPQVANEWVFIIDSDERCSPELKTEIEKILSQEKIEYDGFIVYVKTKFLGKLHNHEFNLGHYGMRLVRRETYKTYELLNVHSRLRIKNHSFIKNKKAYLEHEPIRDFKQHIYKMARYAEWSAKDMYNKGKRAKWYHFVFRPPYKFFHHYIILGGFLDGIGGLILSGIAGIGVFLKYYALFFMEKKDK